jgi:hypothetical protein
MGFAFPFYRSLYKAEFFYFYALRSAGHILGIYLYTCKFLGVSQAFSLLTGLLHGPHFEPAGGPAVMQHMPSLGTLPLSRP